MSKKNVCLQKEVPMEILYDTFDIPPPPETAEARVYSKRKNSKRIFKYRTETEEI